MKSLYKILLIVFANLFCLHANSKDYIKLSGWIDPSIIAKFQSTELILRVKENAGVEDKGTVFKTPINSTGRFKIEIPTKENLLYISFESTISEASKGNLGGQYNITKAFSSPLITENYLFERGDSIEVFVTNKGTIKFSGKRSAKLNCQSQVNNLSLNVNSVGDRISQTWLEQHNFPKALKLYKETVTQQINLKRLIMESYKDELSPQLYKILYVDAISSAQFLVYENLYGYLMIQNGQVENINEIKKCFDEIIKTDYNGNDDSFSSFNSTYFANMIVQKEILRSRLLINNASQDWSFNKTYDNLKNSYIGNLRDKAIYILYEGNFNRQYDKAIALKNDAQSVMTDGIYKDKLNALINKQSSTYPFKFWDINDKIHQLEDFKGKVIVLDFWFTGCIPCAMLAKAMHPIYEKYKSDKDIVFVTVSTDRKTLWVQSVASGKYTSPGMLNLHTNGQGFLHPLIMYYKFTGLPQQMIIDKNGQLVTLSPPRADVGSENVKIFEEIIEKHLKM